MRRRGLAGEQRANSSGVEIEEGVRTGEDGR
jgi:hypothetical protein